MSREGGKRRRAHDVGTSSVTDQLLAAYAASSAATVLLVRHLDRAVWRAPPPFAKGRTIAAIVAHVHNCGLRYLERTAPTARVPGELDRARVTPAEAIRALTVKRRAVQLVVGAALRDDRRLIGWPYRTAEYLTYYLAHDAHHRGQILLQARWLEHPLARDIANGIWQWRKIARA